MIIFRRKDSIRNLINIFREYRVKGNKICKLIASTTIWRLEGLDPL
jgi:hypothetical protein